MRISISLVLVLAAITLANATAFDSGEQPKHKLVPVKKGSVEQAKHKADHAKHHEHKAVHAKHHEHTAVHAKHPEHKPAHSKSGAEHGKHLDAATSGHVRARAAAVDTIADAAEAVPANVERTSLDLVASYVFTVSDYLDKDVQLADDTLQIKDAKQAKVSAQNMMGTVEKTLSAAVLKLNALSKSDNASAQRRGVVDGVETTLSGVTSTVDRVVQLKRELLDGVDSTLSGVTSTVDRVVQLKRELLDGVDTTLSGVTSTVDRVVQLKRELLEGVDSTLSSVTSDLPVDKVLSLKRELLDGIDTTLSRVTDDVDLNKVAGLRRQLLQGVDTTLSRVTSDLSLNKVAGLKRELLNTVDTTLSSVTDGLDVDKMAGLKRHLLDTVDTTLSNVDTTLSGATSAVSDTVHDAPLARDASDTMLADSIDALYTSTTTMLAKIVDVSDAIHDEEVSKEVKNEVVPLFGMMGLELFSFVDHRAPQLKDKVNRIVDFVGKTDKSLP